MVIDNALAEGIGAAAFVLGLLLFVFAESLETGEERRKYDVIICFPDEENDSKKSIWPTILMTFAVVSLCITLWALCYKNRDILFGKNLNSKDTPKTAQVQKFRTTVNNYKTANWNNFAQKIK